MSPIVLHIPHASKEIPKGVRSTFLPGPDSVRRRAHGFGGSSGVFAAGAGAGAAASP